MHESGRAPPPLAIELGEVYAIGVEGARFMGPERGGSGFKRWVGPGRKEPIVKILAVLLSLGMLVLGSEAQAGPAETDGDWHLQLEALTDFPAQVGGRRSVEPIEMLQVVHVDPMFEVANAELVVNDGERARVRLESTDGRAHELVLVLQDGQWRVVIPVAADPEAEVADPLAGGV